MVKTSNIKQNDGIIHKFLLLAVSMLVFAPLPARAMDEARLELSVLADKNLLIPLTQIARDYNRAHHINISIIARTGADTTSRIRDGLLVDVVISGDLKVQESLQQSGLIDLQSGVDILNDKAVFTQLKHNVKRRITPAARQEGTGFIPAFDAKFIADYQLLLVNAGENVGFALAEDAARLAALPEKVDSVFVEDFQTLLKRLHENTRAVAVLPRHVVQQHPELKLLAAVQQEDGADLDSTRLNGATYRAEVIASEHMRDARAFLQYLASKEAQYLFAKYGFSGRSSF